MDKNVYWYCSWCGSGPMLVIINPVCTECGMERSSDCTTEGDPLKGEYEKAPTYSKPPEDYITPAGERTTSRSPPAYMQLPFMLPPLDRVPLPQKQESAEPPKTFSTGHDYARSSKESARLDTIDPQVVATATDIDIQSAKEYNLGSETPGTVGKKLDVHPNSPPVSDGDSEGSTTGSGTDDIKQHGDSSKETHLALDIISESPISPSVMLYRWLDSVQDDPNYAIIAQACESLLQNEPADAGEASQSTSAPVNTTQGTRNNKSRKKRKALEINGDNDNNSVAASITTGGQSAKMPRKPKFACHFYKMNQYEYASCGNSGYGKICHLSVHLRNEHSLRGSSCQVCWRSFENQESLEAHTSGASGGVCEETGGTPAGFRISKRHLGDYDKWFLIWNELFPRFEKRKPKSPYWEPPNSVGQYYVGLTQSVLDELERTQTPQVTQHVRDLLTTFHEDWRTAPPEPRTVMPAPIPPPAEASGSDVAVLQPGLEDTYQLRDPLRGHIQAPTPDNHSSGVDDLTLLPETASSESPVDTRLQSAFNSRAAEERDPTLTVNVDLPVPDIDKPVRSRDIQELLSSTDPFPVVEHPMFNIDFMFETFLEGDESRERS
ncbi:hypothetical protein GGR52DRAFT_139571 [Hypoxylon sp. FL1284]|nr:hypothetical protein GGR52DRAFT_139571 [Hypoxylon sp. FL1284]